MAAAAQLDWSVTEEKIAELVRRIVSAADPLEIIAFGSRARGDHRPDSDLDLAVIFAGTDEQRPVLHGVQRGIDMPVDLLRISKARFDRFRPWINTVHRQIDREGIRLYERGRQSPDRNAFNISADDEQVLGFEVPNRIFGFHAQQAVEKLYKVLISAHGEEYPFTHDLEKLDRKLSELGESMPELPLALEDLTEFAVETRYDEMPPLSLEVRAAFRAAVVTLRNHVAGRLSELKLAEVQVKNP